MSAADEEHLDRAHAERRSILTRDRDFLRLHSTGVTHSGILFIPRGRSIKQVIDGVFLVHEVLTADEMLGHVEYL